MTSPGETLVNSVPNTETPTQVLERQNFIQNGLQYLGRVAARTALSLSLAVTGGAIAGATAEMTEPNPTAAIAGTGDYPDWNKVCVVGDPGNPNSSFGKSSGPAGTEWCDDYQWGNFVYNDRGQIIGNRQNSSRGYGYRNCTDWVAWRLPNLGIGDVPTGWGNAKNWDDAARAAGKIVDSTPEEGDIAVWNDGAFGHVEVVESVNVDGSVNTSGYNKRQDGNHGLRSNMRADAYIDLNGTGKGINGRTLPGNGGGENPPPPPPMNVNLVHYWQSGSGGTDVVHAAPGGVSWIGPSVIGAVAPGTGQFGFGDFNGDGIKDLYLVSTQGDSSGRSAVLVAQGPSYRNFLITRHTPMGQFSAVHGDIMVADFNRDGKSDIAAFFANDGAPRAALGILDAASEFQNWIYLGDVPIGGHDGARSDAVAGDFDNNGSMDVGVGFHQGTPSGQVALFTLNGSNSYQSVTPNVLPIGGWQDGDAQLIAGKLGGSRDRLGVVYSQNTPTGRPDLFIVDGSNVSGWTLPLGYAPSGQRAFVAD